MKKIVGVFVCMMLIGTVLPVSGNIMLESVLTSLSSGNTLFVGGSGPGNYSKIQDAVDNTSNGDTVFVFDDSSPYYERVQINTSISLIGEDKDTTVICAISNGDVITISSNNVSIHELTIKNASGDFKAGIKIGLYFGFCIISDNIIIDNKLGISLWYSDNNIIEDNNFFNNNEWTITVDYSNDNMISGNNIDHPPGTYPIDGVSLWRSTGNNISGNTIKNCDSGVHLSDSNNNIVTNNVMSSGERDGISIYDGSNNKIIGNNLSYNLYWGIEIRENSNDNIICHNNIEYNYESAVDEGDNIWDDGKYGNYWSDYEEKYPDAKKKKEGIWDTPYEIPSETRENNYDMCPLINQWPDLLSRTLPESQNLWFHRLLDRFPILQKILDAPDMFYDFYENMKGGI